MRSKFKWIFTLLVAFTMQFSFAQEKTITGVVSDANGSIAGANISVQGGTRKTQSDFDGKYSIKANVGDVLVFTFVGMQELRRTVGTSSSISIKMTSSEKVLDAVVVQGYGRKTSKVKNASSVVTVGSKNIEGRPNINFLQTLQGQVPGASIAFNSGSPGSNKIDVIIRGESTINGSKDPLYVIDGVPLNQAFFRNLNPNDIESSSVLKDAAATAIYGNRGTNGVIVINTKKGKYNSGLSVNYSAIFGQALLPEDNYDLTGGKELIRFQREVLPTIGITDSFGFNLTQQEANTWTRNTDWRKVFYRRATSNQQTLSFSSGGERTNNYTSFNYMEQEGLLKNTNFRRFSFRTNFNGKSANDKFNYTTNININFSKRRQVEQETRAGIGNNIVQNPVNGFLKSPAYLDPAFYQSGQQIFDVYGSNVSEATPYTLMNLLDGNSLANFYNELKIFANTDMSYKITPKLTYGFNLGFDYQDDKRVFGNGPNSYLSIVRNANLPTPLPFRGSEQQVTVAELTANFVNRLNFNTKFAEKHTFDITLYTEYFKGHRRVNSLNNNGLDPLTWVPGAGTGWVPQVAVGPNVINYAKTVSASTSNAGLFSYFAVGDYDYNNLFGVGFSFRRDNSFKFVGDNKWGNFYSVSGRFNLDRLDFISKLGFIDELKLRGSYGTVGNQNFTSRPLDGTISPIFLGSQDIRDLNSTQTGYQNNPSVGINTIANTDLRWETTAQANIGLDFSVYNRFSGTVDVYRKVTTDLYLNRIISAVNAFEFLDANSTGTLENRGIELSLRYKVFKKSDFKLDVFANGAKNINEITGLSLAPGRKFLPVAGTIQQIHQVGGPIAQYFAVPYLGVDKATGEQLFQDINGNVTKTPVEADRRATGRNRLPVYQGAFGFDASYKGFSINTLFTYSQDFYRFDDELFEFYDPTQAQFFPVTNDLFNAWTPTNTNTDVPSIQSSFDQINATARSDRFLKDASFIRLKSITVAYDVPSNFLKNGFLKTVRFYVQSENMITWTKWKGLDPENFDADGQGKYPNQRSVSFGIDLKF
jgi:TonB-dependent starch-binding outer membrane protein SusC